MRGSDLIGVLTVVGTLAVAGAAVAACGDETEQRSRPPAPEAAALAPLGFLLGRWEAAGTGTPGTASGTTSFESAADGHALVRHNLAATARGRHADVMLIYSEPAGAIRALYADNEGHVIRYTVTVPPGGREVVFASDGEPGAPRFRLTHRLDSDGTLATRFEIAAPGSTEFTTYLEGVGRRSPT